MRILHTSDWHMGKMLAQYSRLPEQEQFIDELVKIADDKGVGLIIITGDIFDNRSPSAAAETLYYQSLLRLSDNGRRPVVVIAGNHDDPRRLMAASQLAAFVSVIVIGFPSTVAPVGKHKNYSITDSGAGYVEIETSGQKVVIIAMPYPSERMLDDAIDSTFNQMVAEKDIQKAYSDKIALLFKNMESKFRSDTINIAAGHFYVVGGETSKSERDIQLGGAYAVFRDALPKSAQYTALGHLHRPQQIAKNVVYAGSPIQYHKTEENQAKCVFLVDVLPETEAEIEKIYLTNYRPVEIWKAGSIDEATVMCEERGDRNCFVYLEINTDRTLLTSEIKKIRSLMNGIVEITPVYPADSKQGEDIPYAAIDELDIISEFTTFYRNTKNTEPDAELINLFKKYSNST